MAIVLDSTNKKLEIVLSGAVTANQLPFVASYADYAATPVFTPGSNDGVTNNTTAVTLVAAPASSTQRMVSSISIWNKDTASATVTVQLDNTGTDREIISATLAIGDSLHYAGEAWRVLNSNGRIKSNSLDGLYDAYVCVRDTKAQNTEGGTFTQDAWRTRDINDEQADTAGICSIAANQITLEAGVYRCMISCPAFVVNRHQARLQDVDTPATLLVGTSEKANAIDAHVTRSFIVGRFTLAVQTTMEVQHHGDRTQVSNGFGTADNNTDEIYTLAEFWREA